jgi:hypothetical protein
VFTKTTDVQVHGFRKYWTLKSECYAITNKYPDAATVVQQAYKALSGIDNLAECTLALSGFLL